MTHEFIFSGFGGQGIMLMGQLMAQAGLEDGKYVSWIPSYGPEMRGGTAYCSVVISDDPIGCPVIAQPTAVLAMNLPSKNRFESLVQPGGHLIMNSSLIPDGPVRNDIHNHQVPFNDLAHGLGSNKFLNMMALGSLMAAVKPVKVASVFKAMDKLFGKKFEENPDLAESNKRAFELGCDSLDSVV